MVLKFDEFINEGLWAKGVNRSKTGNERLEDKNPVLEFLKEAEWVEMGHPKFLFCKTQMDHKFSINEIHELSNILKGKYQIMYKNVYYWLRRKFGEPVPVDMDTEYNQQYYVGEKIRRIYFGCDDTFITPLLYLDDFEGRCEYIYLKKRDEMKVSTLRINDPSLDMYEIKFLKLKGKDEDFEF